LTALFLILALVTALSFSCGVPTLFLATCVAAAMPVPLSATRSARHATTIAGEGRRQSFFISYPLSRGMPAL
jgi:F0F1-type ATP synthase assembly protein I